MKDSGMVSMIVKGRIISVSWLEKAPYNAKKVRGEKYFQYELDVSEGMAEQIERDLEDIEKVWANTDRLFAREEPHPAYAGIAAAFKKNPSLQRQLLVGACYFGHALIDNDECQEFAEVQIQKTLTRLEGLRKSALVKEVEHILSEVQKRGGDAYAEYKPRLQELAKI